ncbi:recombinase family protein [Peribacillus sp. NPDC097675]|uniref:recombinase family protein n=1 Tax=Peribacillus sp. NPDC097675 TaxID=3390618 RepID=UPI003CFEF714
MRNGEKKRVWCLYRVSTMKQVATDDDIPIQKNACHDFVNHKQGWEITNELIEKGVSGWSKKADERDALNTIKQAALDKELDVLLVFMFDRLGRREDETPLIVNFLNQNAIEVWSTQEGRRNTESHIDKLLNYISFWQSDGESQKTSMRVREAKKQLSEQGYFQGGVAPIGYRILETNRLHWKNKDRYLKELAVDEGESEMIKLIFSLYVDRHMGYRKIVDYLNNRGYRNREGNLFGVSTIQRILSNPIYIGKKRYKGFNGEEGHTQPYNETLQIVSDDLFKQAEQIRSTRRNHIRKQDKSGIPLAGKLMFSGLAHCKYCGAKLSGNYLYRKQKGTGDSTVSYRYKCPLNKGKANGEHVSSTWEAKKYDGILMQQVKAVLSQLDLSPYMAHAVHKQSHLDQCERNLKRLDKEYLAWMRQLEKLQAEISKSLVGESAFTPEQLSGAIEDINRKVAENAASRMRVKADMENRSSEVNDVEHWERLFDKADNDLKKAMLSRIIDKVILGKDEVEIRFNLTLQECLRPNNG